MNITVKHFTSEPLTARLNSGLCQLLLTRPKIEGMKGKEKEEVKVKTPYQ